MTEKLNYCSVVVHSFTEYSIYLIEIDFNCVLHIILGTAVSSLEYTKLENALEMIEVKIVKARTDKMKQ